MDKGQNVPGAYPVESGAPAGAIVGAETALPLFIGYVELLADTESLVPARIDSMAAFEASFGRRFTRRFYLAQGRIADGDRDWGKFDIAGVEYSIGEAGQGGFALYDSMRLYFANGGGPCFVIACACYADAGQPRPTAEALAAGLAAGAFAGPTVVAIPDATKLVEPSDHAALCVAMLEQAAPLDDRMVLLDLWGADGLSGTDDFGPVVAAFRAGLGAAPPESLRNGVAYFPPLVTTLVTPADLDMRCFDLSGDRRATLVEALTRAAQLRYFGDPMRPVLADIDAIGDTELTAPTDRALADALTAALPEFAQLVVRIAAAQSLLPPSGAMAGLWVANDAAQGVWIAPANLAIAGIQAPCVQIGDNKQAGLSMPLDGLAVNALRSFQNPGMVWGARTLDGNSQDWRYINARRTFLYIETSIRTWLATLAALPNAATTWATVAAAINAFLQKLWAAGGLQGARASDAFSVAVGMGSTMTAQDLLDNVMRVQVEVAITHPAEFLVIALEQQMLSD